jgi:hypothetical protein
MDEPVAADRRLFVGRTSGLIADEENSSTMDCIAFLASTTTTLELVVGTAPGGAAPAGVVDMASCFDFATGTSISGPDIAIVPGQILLAWDNGGLISTNVQVRPFDGGGNPVGPAQAARDVDVHRRRRHRAEPHRRRAGRVPHE